MADEATVNRGRQLFGDTCVRCHGENAIGGVKDLRFMAPEVHARFNEIVLGGALADKGMAGFADVLDEEQANAIHQFLIARGNEDYADASAGQ